MKPSDFSGLFTAILAKGKKAAGGAPPHWEDGLKPTKQHDEGGVWSEARMLSRNHLAMADRITNIWRGCFLASAAIVIVTAGGWIWQSIKQTTETIFVPYDRQTGELGELLSAKVRDVPDVVEAAQLKSIIRAAFSKSSDDNVNKYFFSIINKSLAGKAREEWNEWHKGDSVLFDQRWIPNDDEANAIIIKPTTSKDVYDATWKYQPWKSGKAYPWVCMSGTFYLKHNDRANINQLNTYLSQIFVTNMLFTEQACD